MYNFLFDKKSLFLLLAGMVVAGGVLFFSGLLVGVQWGLPVEAAVAPPAPRTPRMAQVPPKRATFLPADRPCRPEPEAKPAPTPAPAAPVAAPAPKPDLRVSVEPPPPVPAPAPAAVPIQTMMPAVARTPEPATPVTPDRPGRLLAPDRRLPSRRRTPRR